MRSSLLHWLSWRVRLVCLGTLVLSGLLPAYIPKSALSMEENALPPQQYQYVEDGFLMKTSSLGQQGARLAYDEGIVHVVTSGETVASIAKQYSLSPDTIRWVNGLEENVKLQASQEIFVLPVDGVLHVVRRGQTLARIAQLYDIPESVISQQNKLQGGFIVTGQQLIIPGGKPIGGGTVIAQDDLRFTDKLPSKDIQLPLSDDTKPGQPAKITALPSNAATADLTQGVLQLPCNDCFFTQYYHPGHYAVDIQTRGGGPVFAAEDGTVIRADTGWNGGYGNVVEIDHGNGLVTLYGHNKALLVKNGEQVHRGEEIALMGNTGLVYGPTGIHTHFEVRVNGVKKNPLLYLE